MFQYKIINEGNFIYKEDIIKEIFSTINNEVNINQNWTINIVFVSDEEIQNLNKNYRDKDKVTDVLSFHYFDDFSMLKEEDTAWEVILSLNKIRSQWIEYWLWEEKEFYKLIIHSVLHILWYDHETDNDYEIMQWFENKIWAKIFDSTQV